MKHKDHISDTILIIAGVSVVTGFSLFLVWYVKGCRRFLPFLLLGITILLLAFAYPALLIVGHFIIYSFVAITLLWLILIVSLVFFSNVSVLAGLCSLPILIWTTYTAFFNFYPFYNELFGDQQERWTNLIVKDLTVLELPLLLFSVTVTSLLPMKNISPRNTGFRLCPLINFVVFDSLMIIFKACGQLTAAVISKW